MCESKMLDSLIRILRRAEEIKDQRLIDKVNETIDLWNALNGEIYEIQLALDAYNRHNAGTSKKQKKES